MNVLKVMMEEDNRVPNKHQFPKIGLLEHEEIMDAQAIRNEVLKSQKRTIDLRIESPNG